MRTQAHRLRSVHLGNQRTIWVREPKVGSSAERLVVFLDAEIYRGQIGAAKIVEEMEARSQIGPSLCAFISHESVEARWIECPCHPPFARFIDQEFFPWFEGLYPEIARFRERVIVGVSYTGLAAAFVPMQAPARFTKIVAQSGSFWSNDCWLVDQYRKMPVAPQADFYLDVGTKENQENVRHKEDVLQTISQIDGVRRFRDALLEKGIPIKYVEFDGGHDSDSWRGALPDALRWALQTADGNCV